MCFEKTSGLAFKFNCSHICCWSCTQKWDASTPGVMTCPSCRDSSLRKGDYFCGAHRPVEVIHSSNQMMLLACAHPIQHLPGLSSSDIEVVHELTGWWSTACKDRALVLEMLSAVRRDHNELILDLGAVIRRVCAWCGVASLLQCSGCRALSYCSTNCQTKHWPLHKSLCHSQARGCTVLPGNCGTIHWPRSRPLKVTFRAGATIFIGVSGSSSRGLDLRRGAHIFDAAFPCVAVHMAGMRTVETCVETVSALLDEAGIRDEELVATVVGGGTRVCSKESHEHMLAVFMQAKLALVQGRQEPAAFRSVRAVNVTDEMAAGGAFTGAGVAALCVLFRLGPIQVRFAHGFDATYTIEGHPVTIRMQPLGLPDCSAPVMIENPQIGRQIAVLRGGQITVYLSGEECPSESEEELRMKRELESVSELQAKNVLGQPQERRVGMLGLLRFCIIPSTARASES